MSLEKIINLIKKTKEKVIIINPDSEDVFVILPFEEYGELLENKFSKSEKLLTENKFIDTINRDIALNVSKEKALEKDEFYQKELLEQIPEETVEDAGKESGEKFYFEPVE